MKVEYKIGKQSNKEWSGVYGYKPELESELENLGEMYAVLRLGIDVEDFELERLAKLLIEELQKSYYESKKNFDSVIELLEDAVWKMKSRIEVIFSREEDLKDVALDIELAICIVKDVFLYGVILGESKIYIQRDDNFVDISEAFVDLKMSGLIKSGSLKLEHDDRLALSTSKAANIIEEDLSEVLINLDASALKKIELSAGSSLMLIADESLNWKTVQAEITDEHIEEVRNNENDLDNEEVISEDFNEGTEITAISAVAKSDDFLEKESEEFINDIESESNDGALDQVDEDFENSALQPKSDNPQNHVAETAPNDEELEVLTSDSKLSVFENIKNRSITAFGNIKSRIQKKNTDKFFNEESGESKTNNAAEKVQEAAKKIAVVTKGATQKIKDHFDNNQTTYVQIIKNFRKNFFKFLFGIKDFLKNDIIGTNTRRLDERKRLKRNRWLFGIAVIIVVIIGININNNIRATQAENQKRDSNQSKLTEIQNAYSNWLSQYDRSLSLDDKQQASTSAGSIESSINSILNSQTQKETYSLILADLEEILINLNSKKSEILGIETFETPVVIANFSQYFDNVDLTDLVYTQEYIFIPDRVNNVIYRVRREANSLPEQFITGLTQPQLVTLNESGDIIFYDQNTTSTLGKFSPLDAGSIARFNALAPAVVGSIKAFDIYDVNGALYEIHQNTQQIFKRIRVGDQFAGGGAELSEGDSNWRTDGEFSSAIDIKVNGSIYVLIQNQGIKRYFAGGENNLTDAMFAEILPSDLQSIKSSTTAFDLSENYLVAAVPSQKKIFIFSLQGDNLVLQKQIQYTGKDNIFQNIKGVEINEAASQIFVLDNDKLLRFSF